MKTLPRLHRRDEHPPQRRDIPPQHAAPRAAVASAVGSDWPDPVHKPLDYSDMRGGDEPDWAQRSSHATGWTPGRFRPEALVPVTRLAVVPLPAADDDPLAALYAALDEPAPATDWTDALRGVETHTARRISNLSSDVFLAINDFPIDHRFVLALAFDAFDELNEKLSDEILTAYGVYEDEAADIELIAVEFGLPMRAEVTL